MKRLMVILFVVGLFCLFYGIDPAFARDHRDAPMGGFSLWQIFIGGIFVLVMFSIFAGGGDSKQKIEKEKKENKERIDREKAKKGLFKYYGEGVGAMLLYWAAPFILVGLIWSCNQIFE